MYLISDPLPKIIKQKFKIKSRVYLPHSKYSYFFINFFGTYVLRYMFIRNEKESTVDNEKPFILCYRPFVEVFFFSISKTYFLELMVIEYFLKI